MSTKCTVAYGDDFHLYNEIGDERNVYFELEGKELDFSISPDRVVVSIPLHIWEVIRQYKVADLSYANMTDEELLQEVEGQVDGRIKDYNEATTERGRVFAELMGGMIYGSPEEPREKQIEEGLECFYKIRDRQRIIQQKIRELEKSNRKPY